MTSSLYRYQQEGVAFLADRRYALLADEMGLGKTVQAIKAADAIGARHILVVCPLSLAANWQKEIERWSDNPQSALCRQPTDFTFMRPRWSIVNYEMLKKVPPNITYDLMILDEAHYIKNPKSQRTVAVFGKDRKGDPPSLFQRCARVWFLTGTPVLNRPIDLWPFVHFVMRHRSWWFYVRDFCNAKKTPFGLDVSGASNTDQLHTMLKPYLLRRRKAEVLKELPPKVVQVLPLEPEQAMSRLASRLASIVATSASGALQRYIDSGLAGPLPPGTGELATIRRELGLAKVKQVTEIVNNILESEQKCVVFAIHKDVVSLLRDALKQHGVVTITGDTPVEERNVAVDRFQNSKNVRVIIGTIGAMGVGLTLTASSTVVFAEIDWSPALMQQAEDRCHRIGQQNVVCVQLPVAPGSIEERIASLVAWKSRVAACIVDGVEHAQTQGGPKWTRFFRRIWTRLFGQRAKRNPRP
ncbi:MAG TPA: DEAD/DEAH box helicase [Myxococcota bacterium]|nr:DEAD/DEAH box helicase [Myxococcota bacterium]HQK51845.1 DEAD/DEAH box helicase [Myxococcota bacterium]